MPILSVIIPVYNVSLYLDECLNSVVHQSLQDIEIICINDGSTDNSLDILKKWGKKDHRIIILDQKNKGVSTARNEGLKIAQGNYITFVDADDMVCSNIYSGLIPTMQIYELDAYIFAFKTFPNERIETTGFPTNTILTWQELFASNPQIQSKNSLCFNWRFIYKKEVLRKKANLGLAFDGDSDRVIAVDEKGNEVDGDKILYLLANHLKKQNKLTNNLVVGTKLTNLGIQNKLKENGIDIVLADIGDKYVVEEMITHNALLGGEKAGHIILSEYLLAGDGILTGIKIAEIMKKEQKTLSSLTNVEIYPQCSINCRVKDKDKIVSNMDLKNLVKDLENKVGNKARILVRKSGTEMLVRIMVESKDDNLAKELAKILEEKVKEIEEGN